MFIRGKIPHFRLTCVAPKRRCLSSLVKVLNNLTQEPYSFPDIHTDPKDTVKRTTLQPKITF